MKFVKKYIKYFDTYGKGIILNVNGKDNITSFLGGFFSLIYLIFFLTIFSLNAYDFLFNRSPIITLSTNFRDINIIESFSNSRLFLSNFFFDFGNGSPKGLSVFPKQSYGFAIKISLINDTEQASFSNFSEMIKCEDSDLFMQDSHFSESYQSLHLRGSNFLSCLNFTNGSVFIGGDPNIGHQSTVVRVNMMYNLCEFPKR